MKHVKLKWLVSGSNAGEVIDKSYWGDGHESLYTCARDILRSDFSDFPKWKRTTTDDLLLTRNGTPYIHIPVEGAIYSNVVQRISVPKVDKYYLRYALEDRVRSFRGYGVSIESLNYEMWSNLEVALPDLETQRQIADFLDRETARIDLLIEKKQRLVALLEEKREQVISRATIKGLNPQVAMTESGIPWLGEVPAHWTIQPIKYLVSRSLTDGPHVTPLKRDEGVPFISAEAIADGRINFEKKWGYISIEDHRLYSRSYKPQKHDVFVVKLGATTGRVARVETDLDFNIWVPLAAIRPKTPLLSKLIYFALQSSQIRDAYQVLWTYGTQQTLGLGTLSKIRLPVPPDSEINEIANYIEKQLPAIERVSRSTLASIDRLKEYRSALITAAVTGQIDVQTYGKSGTVDRRLDAIQEEMEA